MTFTKSLPDTLKILSKNPEVGVFIYFESKPPVGFIVECRKIEGGELVGNSVYLTPGEVALSHMDVLDKVARTLINATQKEKFLLG